MNDIRARILQVILRELELNIGDDELQRADSLDELFGMDSVAILELVVGIENEFNLTIPPEHLTLTTFKNVDTIASLVCAIIQYDESNGEPDRTA